jgi:hypothetical protein
MQDMMMMMAIMQLLNGNQNQNSPQSSIDGEPASNEEVVLAPTPTPTPTPTPEPAKSSDGKSAASKSSPVNSDAAIVSSQQEPSTEAGGNLTNRLEIAEADVDKDADGDSRTAEWEVKREGMF